MARLNDRYSMNRRDKKLAGVCSTIGEVFNLDPTFIRIGFVAAAILVSWKLALVAYVGAGIYLAIASMLNLSPSWMGIGTLVIALLAAIGVMASESASSPPVRR